MFLFYVITFFKKGDTIQGGTLFEEIRYIPFFRVHDTFQKEILVRKPERKSCYFFPHFKLKLIAVECWGCLEICRLPLLCFKVNQPSILGCTSECVIRTFSGLLSKHWVKVPTKYLGGKERSFIGKVGASLANLMSNCHTKVTEYQ